MTFISMFFSSGEPVSTVLTILRDVHSPFHDALIREYENYSACVGLMETGYFRKRTSSADLSFLGPFFASDHQHLYPTVTSGQDQAMGIRDLFSRYLEESIRGGEDDVDAEDDRLLRESLEKGWIKQLTSNGEPTAYAPDKLNLLKVFRNLLSRNQ